MKVLIVEDDETSQMLISIILNTLSAEVLTANTGIDAIEICRKNMDLDLILMDIKMPIMNGYEATKAIREFNKDVVIIAQTAFGLIGDREKAIKAGCTDYISKPITKDELIHIIMGHI